MKRAVKAAGGARVLADKLKVTPEAIYLWIKQGCVPPKRCLEVEKLTGVSRHKLNPKIYGPAPK